MGGKYFVLQSNENKKYLEYVSEPEAVRGLNRFSGEIPVNPFGFYKIEKAKTGSETGRKLVHIKCCYNNKYLVRRARDLFLITSTADEPEEDKSKWSCTLFEILSTNLGGNTIRLRHVQLGHFVCHDKFDSCLMIGCKEVVKGMCYDFTIYVGDIQNDGTYTGVNSCNFKYETKEEKLAAASDLIELLAS